MKRAVVLLFFITFALSGCATAEEAAYGKVLEIDSAGRMITLEAYDYQNDREIEVVYHIKKNCEFEGVEDLNGIMPGDWVDLDFYTDEDGEKVTSFIMIEREPDMEEALRD